MFATLKNRFTTIKSNLTSLDSQPLSKASLIIILILSIHGDWQNLIHEKKTTKKRGQVLKYNKLICKP